MQTDCIAVVGQPWQICQISTEAWPVSGAEGRRSEGPRLHDTVLAISTNLAPHREAREDGGCG